MKPKRRAFKLNVPEDLLSAIRREAENQDRSVTVQINRMLARQAKAQKLGEEVRGGTVYENPE